jgi:alpha-1,2-mannosyltransferase
VHDGLPSEQLLADRSMRGAPQPAAPAATPWYAAPWARLLWCALIGGMVHVGLWQISEPPTLFSDFYKAYFPAGEVLWEAGWQASFPFTEVGAGGFVNVPIIGWLFVPLVPLGEEAAGWVFLAIGAGVTICAYWMLTRLARPELDAAPALLLLFLFNGPLINSLREGNTTHFILLLLVVSFGLLQRRSDFAAGLLLGVCAVIKLPLLLYGVYFLLRRRWRVVAGGASAIIAVLLLSVATFGITNNVGWFDCCIEPFLGGIIPAFNVQSIDGFAMRLLTGTSQLANWDPLDPPAAYRVIRLCIFAAILAAAVLVARRAGGHENSGREVLEFSLVLTLALVLSPISWSHYYLWLLLPWALYLGGRLPLAHDGIARRLVWTSLGLASLPVVVLPLQPDLLGEAAARTLVSAWLIGGLAMLAALMRGLYVLGGQQERAA